MPELIRFLLRHALTGAAAACFFVAIILAFDIGSIATLATSSDVGLLALGMLTFALALTFGAAQIAFAVFSDQGDGHGEDQPRQ